MTHRKVVRIAVGNEQVRTATGSWRPLAGRVLALSAVLCGFLLAAQSSKADEFTFHDVTDSATGLGVITVTNDTHGGTTRVVAAGCNLVTMETPCLFHILPGPAINALFPVLFSSSTGPAGLIDGSVENPVPSDEISFSALSSNGLIVAQVNFDSCNDEVTGPCAMQPVQSCGAAMTGGCFQEGTRVHIGTIFWSNSTNAQDDIFAVSDTQLTPPVPEPSSLILLGSGLLMAGGFLRRRLVTP